MKFSDKVKAKAVIRRVADQYGVAVSEVRREMQAALDAAWDNPDEQVQEQQRRLFPEGKPSLELFLVTLAKDIKGD